MSFLNIRDPKERDKIVAEYLQTRHRIQQRNEDERSIGLAKQEQLSTLFNPIVEAQHETTREIKSLKPPQTVVKRSPIIYRKRTWDDNRDVSALEFYEREYPQKAQEKYYGIVRDEQDPDQLFMGDKRVNVENNDVIVDEVVYTGTPGLWSLIMEAVPKQYTREDMENYKRLVEQTDVRNNPRRVTERSRPTSTAKRRLLDTIFTEEEREDEEKKGSGNIFLPGDIKGLKTKLDLLLAEYRAGNTSATRNQIVSILDELLRRKRISRKEYNEINKFLSLTS